jgi:hypothetical protein
MKFVRWMTPARSSFRLVLERIRGPTLKRFTAPDDQYPQGFASCARPLTALQCPYHGHEARTRPRSAATRPQTRHMAGTWPRDTRAPYDRPEYLPTLLKDPIMPMRPPRSSGRVESAMYAITAGKMPAQGIKLSLDLRHTHRYPGST